MLYTFEGDVLRIAVDTGEIEAESEFVGEDLVVFRDRGVGIFDVIREVVGFGTELDSRERLVGAADVLTEGNDNW